MIKVNTFLAAIASDGASSWSFGNYFAKNFEMFYIDNNSSSHTDNCKIIFLLLDERPTDDI